MVEKDGIIIKDDRSSKQLVRAIGLKINREGVATLSHDNQHFTYKHQYTEEFTSHI
ncbi:MAG: hypothetical protein ACLVJN_10715 [Streptococcus parasanguinis]